MTRDDLDPTLDEAKLAELARRLGMPLHVFFEHEARFADPTLSRARVVFDTDGTSRLSVREASTRDRAGRIPLDRAAAAPAKVEETAP